MSNGAVVADYLPENRDQEEISSSESFFNPPCSLTRDISPPPSSRKQTTSTQVKSRNLARPRPTPAAVEAGLAQVQDHFTYWTKHLLQFTRSPVPLQPRLSMQDFISLYQRNQHPHGHHFVIHQHDHPLAGVHYDLRLQISESSSISWAIMYGLPGNAESRRIRRNATETRVHNLWNHLIESASHATGSLLIWDTGNYSILPKTRRIKPPETDDELSASSNISSADSASEPAKSESEKLHAAFAENHIRLRLHGTRLPPGYTISLRLPADNDRAEQPARRSRKRRRKDQPAADLAHHDSKVLPVNSDEEAVTSQIKPVIGAAPGGAMTRNKNSMTPVPAALQEHVLNDQDDILPATDSDLEAETIRLSNAYPGATNNIGSIHQRQWFITLDRANSGFVRTVNRSSGQVKWAKQARIAHLEDNDENDGDWNGAGDKVKGRGRRKEQSEPSGWDPFFVMGRDVERSVVTGRLAREVMADEGVEGYVGRKMWRAVVE